MSVPINHGGGYPPPGVAQGTGRGPYQKAEEFAKAIAKPIDPTKQIMHAYIEGYNEGQHDLREQARQIADTPTNRPEPCDTPIKKERLFP